MRLRYFLTIFFLLFVPLLINGQSETYMVSKSSISTGNYDEICPVYFNGGLVFCSNRMEGPVGTYSASGDKGLFKIFYIEKLPSDTKQKTRLFSKELTSKFNDGPVTFNKEGTVIYFSSNIFNEGGKNAVTGQRNKLGIFYSSFTGKEWKVPREMRFNNEWYNCTTPGLTPDGKKLFFASDMPGGYGGSDIYFCTWENDYWSSPVNVGPAINTSGNEVYPFMCSNNELFFSSDGHQGFGGKDIYYSKYNDSVWSDPVHIDAPVNSRWDDISLITDPLMGSGYFSSNRDGTFDVFSFVTLTPQILYCKEQRQNQNCFRFKDDNGIEINPDIMHLEWTFDGSDMVAGSEVVHCFPGPGHYKIEEAITELKTGKKILVKQFYDLDIKEIEQPFITSPDFAVVNDILDFNGLKSSMPGYSITNYMWDFGDRVKATGSTVNHSFKSAGDFKVKLELTLKKLSSGDITRTAVFKTIKVFNDSLELKDFVDKDKSTEKVIPLLREYNYAFLNKHFDYGDEEKKYLVFNVTVLSSSADLKENSREFKNLKSGYYVKKVTDGLTGLNYYVVAEETDFFEAYRVLKEIISLGYTDAVLKVRTMTSAEEKELYTLKKVYGIYADNFFGEKDSRITSGGLAYFDQVATLMTNYPTVKILIESYTDRAGRVDLNMQLSLQRAQAITSYLVSKGVENKRVIIRAYGDKRPLVLNGNQEEMKKNQRIDLMIIRE